MGIKKFKISILLILLLVGKNLFPQGEAEIKRRLIQKHPIEKSWKKLELIRVLPTPEEEEKMIYFSNPANIDTDDNFIYVVDNTAHKILKFEKNGKFKEIIGRKGEGPGEFMFPANIRTSKKGNLFVYEGGNLRFQIIDSMGKIINSFRTFYSIHDFVVINDSIYANCIYSDEGKENPLIVKYDMNGKIVKSFGKRIDRKGHKTFDSRVFLIASENEIVVVFRYYPIIQRYTLDGKLIKEFRLELDILNKLGKYNFNKEYTTPNPYTIRLIRLTAGAKTIDKRIFILLHLPRLEIVEIDVEGNLKNYYYSNELKNVINFGGFTVIKNQNSLLFYVLQSYEEPKLYIFKAKNGK